MSVPQTSIAMSSFVANSQNLLEMLQNITFEAQNTLVNGKGIADRYPEPVLTKQKQTVSFMAHWLDVPSGLPSSNLNITVWTLAGTVYLGQIKRGTIEVQNTGPEVSGIAVAYEYPVATNTPMTITSDIMVVTEAYWTYTALTGNAAAMDVSFAITWSGEPFFVNGVLRTTQHTVRRDETQMENMTGESTGAPTTSGDTTSLLYLAAVGSALTQFSADTGANAYGTGIGQYALISRISLRFEDKQLTQQEVTLEIQGDMSATAG